MQGHRIGLLQQFVKGLATVGVAHRQLLLDIVEHDAHAQSLRQHGQLRADIAVSDDAQGLAANLMGAGSGLVPQAMAHVMRVGGNAAHQADDVADHQFHHGTGVGIRGVEHADAMLARIIEIHLIGADAEASDRGQGRACVDDRCGHGRLGPYAEQAHAVKRLDEFLLAQGALARLHFETVIAQRLRRIRVNVFQ